VPRSLATVAGLAAAAVAGEAVARAVNHVEPEPLWWHDLFTQRKEAQMRRLAREGGVDVVFIGSSKMLYGVDPDVIAARTGLRCYNASIYRGVPTVSEAWLHDRVLELLRPQVVVVGMSPTEVNDNSPLNTRLEEYRAAPVFSASGARRLLLEAGHRSAAARFVRMAKQPRRMAGAVAKAARTPEAWRWSLPTEIEHTLGPSGQCLSLQDRSYGHGPRMYALIRSQAGENYDNGGVQSDALARIVSLVAAHGARTVFAAMPAATEFLDDLFEGGRPAWAREWERLRKVAADAGTPVVDVAEGFEDHRWFADMVHLNGIGRQEFSERLAAALAPELDDLIGEELT
jgi:hypothetical protein